MSKRMLSAVSALAAAGVVASGILALSETAGAQEHESSECTVNLALAGQMKDILSNALVRGLQVPRRDVALFLDGAQDRYANGSDLLKATAAHFHIAEDVLAAKVEKYRHTNCSHPPVGDIPHRELYLDPQAHPDCAIDLMLAGQMSDVLSNALVLGMEIPSEQVYPFLDGAGDRFEDGPEVLAETVAHFNLNEALLAAEVLKFKHINCRHEGGGETGSGFDAEQFDHTLPLSAFAKDVTLHVVLHEIGHALIREFDIPILGNEETVADAFATYYLTTCMPDRAVDVLSARVTSLMIEAAESPRPDWIGEHDHDARRAHQIAALAVAADPVKYKPVADIVGMSADSIEDARDYGSEIHRSWRRTLAPLWMAEGSASPEARVTWDDGSALLIRLCEDGMAAEIESALKRFDWHSQVTVRFVEGDGGAGWNRSHRAVTVNSAYVRRFIQQGAHAEHVSRGVIPEE